MSIYADMGIYTGIDGTAKKVSRLYIGVGNKAKYISKGYIGVGGKAKLFYDTVLLGELPVGKYIMIYESDKGWQVWKIVHQGNPNTSIYDSSCTGTWLMRAATIAGSVQWENSNVSNPYDKNSLARRIVENKYARLSKLVQSYVRSANIPIYDFSKKTIRTYTAKTFVPDAHEVFPAPKNIVSGSKAGALLDYFKPNKNALRIAYDDDVDASTGVGVNRPWWTRTHSTKGWTYHYNCAVAANGSQYDRRVYNQNETVTIRPFMICDPNAIIERRDMRNGIGTIIGDYYNYYFI